MGNQKKQQEVWSLANHLMRQHGLIDKRWSFGYNKRKKALGVCSHSKRKIELSSLWVETLPMEQIERTILHEIAHALAPADAGHGPKWKEMCCLVGIPDEARCFTDKVIGTEFRKTTAKWKVECPTCGKVTYKHKRTYPAPSCGVCSSSYNPQHKLIYSLNK